jgi:hypothetical protein
MCFQFRDIWYPQLDTGFPNAVKPVVPHPEVSFIYFKVKTVISFTAKILAIENENFKNKFIL